MNTLVGRPPGEHDAKRMEIAQATWAVIAENGFEKASMRAIARKAGYTTGVLVHYFENKEALLDYAFQKIAGEVQDALRMAGKAESVVTALHDIALESLPLDSKRRTLTAAWQSFIVAAEKNTRLRGTISLVLATHHRLLTDLIKQGQVTGEIRDDMAASDMADQINAMSDGLSRLALLQPERLTPETLIRVLAQQIQIFRKDGGENPSLQS